MRNKSIMIIMAISFLFSCEKRKLESNIVLNDLHSKLNATKVAELHYPQSSEDIVKIILLAKQKNKAISISGGKHAMGGQQFGEDTIHISMKKMNDVLSFNKEKGIITVEAGIEWPQIINYLATSSENISSQWSIIQKQTGGDRLSIGGSISANAHGRGVKFKPIIQDIESFTLINSDGKQLIVNRQVNKELFNLVIGGYGLFGVIATVDLRLQKKFKLQRVVEVISINELVEKTKQRLVDGYLYGDFQYKTDEKASDFMKLGVFSTYKPVPLDTPMPEVKAGLDAERWNKLLLLCHTDKSKAFDFYQKYYLSTNGNIYWSDTHQLSYYNEDYEKYLEKTMPDYQAGSLMITEAYVPRKDINVFIDRIAEDAKTYDFNIIYGTMRLIEQDDESFLAWAKQNYACVIFNLRMKHTTVDIEKAKLNFQRIIDRALELNGSYFLTYHRYAKKEQLLKAYPQFIEFLKLKLKYDPKERFQSDWYRHYKKMFERELKK